MATFLPRAFMRPVAAIALLTAAVLCAVSAGAVSAQERRDPFAFVPTSGQRGARPRIIIRPPVFRSDSVGRLVAEPNVQVRSIPKPIKYERYENTTGKANSTIQGVNLDIAAESPPAISFHEAVHQTVPSSHGAMPGSLQPSNTGYYQRNIDTLMPPAPQPVFGELVSDVPGGVIVLEGECEGGDCDVSWCDECHPFKQMFAFKLFKTSLDPGIGRERVRFALMEVERSEPLNSFSIRYNAFNGLKFPDRAEYFWAMQGRSPAVPERKVDYQEIILRLEQGGGRFSMFTEIPFRVLDPVVNGNTAGLSDISFGPKTVIVDGKRWQFSHIFSTIIATGAVTRGLSTGHTSLEPGFMLRYKWSDDTFIHGDLKWRFPLGGDPVHRGDVLKWGLGVSTVLYETDSFAALPTLEIVGWHVQDGLKTQPDGIVAPVDGEAFFSMYPGMRFVLGPSGDLGLFELGVGAGFTFSNNGFFESMFRLDMRFSF